MSRYEETKIKPLRRLHILRYLASCRDYESNADILVSVINEARDGISAYYSDVVADLGWLETKGHVSLAGKEVIVVTATRRGLRIARGEDIDEGIARPDPEA